MEYSEQFKFINQAREMARIMAESVVEDLNDQHDGNARVSPLIQLSTKSGTFNVAVKLINSDFPKGRAKLSCPWIKDRTCLIDDNELRFSYSVSAAYNLFIDP